MSSYSIGQIVYILDASKHSIIGVKIVEQIIRRTQSGEHIEYLASWHKDPGNARPIDDYLKLGEVHDSLAQIEEVMVERAMNAISEIVEKSRTKIDEAFGVDDDVKEEAAAQEPENDAPAS